MNRTIYMVCSRHSIGELLRVKPIQDSQGAGFDGIFMETNLYTGSVQ